MITNAATIISGLFFRYHFVINFKRGFNPPKQWRTFQTKYIGRPQGKVGELPRQFTARFAETPLQALHNFAVGIAVARITRVIAAHGLDPCFGFLHDGRKPGRFSLAWDAVEPLRPKVVRAVFEYAEKHEFERADFLVFVHKITAEKTVRLTAGLAKEIIEVAVKTISVRECVKTAEWLVK